MSTRRLPPAFLSNLLDRLDHYESVLRDIGDLVDSPPADRDLVARWHALESQMQATVDELTLLADEAREQGRDVLKTLRTTAPRADRTLQAPRSSNPLDIAITHHVIVTAAAHSARDAAEQIQRLVEPMSKIADPALLIFSGRLAELAIQLRPPGMDPGPYAPFKS
jgi:hypothetical protein